MPGKAGQSGPPRNNGDAGSAQHHSTRRMEQHYAVRGLAWIPIPVTHHAVMMSLRALPDASSPGKEGNWRPSTSSVNLAARRRAEPVDGSDGPGSHIW